MKSILAVFMACVMCLVSVGCGTPTSNLVVALNAVSDAASVAVVVTQALVATGKLDQATADQVATYASSVGTAVNTASAELNSKDTNPVKIEKITAAFAAAAAPAFGANAPAITAAINAVAATINIFLAQLGSVVTAAKVAPHASLVLNSADKAMLKKIKAKTAETLTAAASLKAKK